jgi:hypothetical protein
VSADLPCNDEIVYVRNDVVLSRHVCELPADHEKCHATALLVWPNLTTMASR